MGGGVRVGVRVLVQYYIYASLQPKLNYLQRKVSQLKHYIRVRDELSNHREVNRLQPKVKHSTRKGGTAFSVPLHRGVVPPLPMRGNLRNA